MAGRPPRVTAAEFRQSILEYLDGGRSEAESARRLGVSVTHYSKVVNGRARASLMVSGSKYSPAKPVTKADLDAALDAALEARKVSGNRPFLKPVAEARGFDQHSRALQRAMRGAVRLVERIWAKVDRSEPQGCWPWRGAVLKNRYTRKNGDISFYYRPYVVGVGGRGACDATRVVAAHLGIAVSKGSRIVRTCSTKFCMHHLKAK